VKENRCLFAAVVGEPNAGKSTLVNSMVGEKISIISHKIQTTRRQIYGIANFENSQIVFVDTPGFCQDKSPLEKVILSNFKNSYKHSDLLILIIDALSKNLSRSLKFIKKVELAKFPLVIAINKVDVAKKENILKLAAMVSEFNFIKKVFMISALTDDGLDDLRSFLIDYAPTGKWLFEKGCATDMPLKFRLSEITREKLFNKLEKDLPYSIYVETELFHESEKKARIYQSIVVIKASQKGIILGKNGNMIKDIKDKAITDMQSLLGKKIELKLFVKVREKWTEKTEHLKSAGILN
jgi:GTP-binding protein Era